jgi:alanine racemase
MRSDPLTMIETAAAVLTVDLGALVENWRLLASRAAPARCGAVVKADAYGLGVVPVVRALLVAGCREFFVALVDEGIRLRESIGEDWPGDARVHVLQGPLPGAERACLEHDLVPVLNGLDQIERWQRLAREAGHPLAAALQADTGMARLGLSAAELARLDAEPARLDGIAPTLVMSHLAAAEDPADPLNALQLQRFAAARRRWPAAAGCLANSSGIFLGGAWHYDLVRPGAALYGVAPIAGAPNPMRPVVGLQARLIQWREVGSGEAVGYNQTWRAKGPARIATVSVGYADGYLRSLSNRATLRRAGTVVPLVGRVSMDTVTVDVSALPVEALAPGAAFDLIDADHDINAIALEAGTNAYEILTSLGPRYARRYL